MRELPNTRIMKLIKSLIPRRIKDKLRYLALHQKLKIAKKKFNKSATEPAWLDQEEFDKIIKDCPIAVSYPYDKNSLHLRAENRVKEILQYVPKNSFTKVLEIGCFDGMVSAELQKIGKKATGIDIREWIDKRALDLGVQFHKMDASKMSFEDNSFDLVFSYDAFEHVAHPDIVLAEIQRVLKKGGHFFLSFGNAYFTPRALHVYNRINIPYCHLLFPREILDKYIQENYLDPIDYDFINEWDNVMFKELWAKNSAKMPIIKYKQNLDLNSIDTIIKYSSCIKNKTTIFDNLIVNDFKILFKKQ